MSRIARTAFATAAAALALAALPSGASADAGCDRHASPTGSDANPGTVAAPVRSIAKLTAILAPGQEGCLPAGATFVEPIGSFILNGVGGAPGAPVTIRTADPAGARAQIKGALWIKSNSHDIVFERVRFTDSPGNNDKGTMLVVHGDRIAFRETEMTWRRGICLNAGHREGYVTGDTASTVAAEGLVIERSTVHDCGNDPQIIASLRSAGQSGVHGLYLINAPGAHIRDNYVYDNVDRGIQLWSDVDGAVVEHNVFDGNGSNVNIGSSAGYGHFSEGNRFEDNVISNAVLRSVYDRPWGPGDTESIVGHFPADSNTRGNVFDGNCVHQTDASKRYAGHGYAHTGDVYADPMYENRAAKDFDLRAGSPCAGMGPGTDPPVDSGDDEDEDGDDGDDSREPCCTDQDPVPCCTDQDPRIDPDPDTAAPKLSLARRPALRRRGRTLRIALISNERARGTLIIRRIGRRGGKRMVVERVELRAGANRISLSLGRRPGRSGYRIAIVAVDDAGNRASLTARARGH